VSLEYLLDTSTASLSMRVRLHPVVLERLTSKRDEIALGAPVLHELLYGIHRLPSSHRRRELESYLSRVVTSDTVVLPYDQAAAEWHARERARLLALGRTPPYVDGQIAAIAATHGLVLVTANLAGFADFQGLTVEDWSVTGPS
jgi:tRNA(fMet)-specific endonuclease VapC